MQLPCSPLVWLCSWVVLQHRVHHRWELDREVWAYCGGGTWRRSWSFWSCFHLSGNITIYHLPCFPSVSAKWLFIAWAYRTLPGTCCWYFYLIFLLLVLCGVLGFFLFIWFGLFLPHPPLDYKNSCTGDTKDSVIIDFISFLTMVAVKYLEILCIFPLCFQLEDFFFFDGLTS